MVHNWPYQWLGVGVAVANQIMKSWNVCIISYCVPKHASYTCIL